MSITHTMPICYYNVVGSPYRWVTSFHSSYHQEQINQYCNFLSDGWPGYYQGLLTWNTHKQTKCSVPWDLLYHICNSWLISWRCGSSDITDELNRSWVECLEGEEEEGELLESSVYIFIIMAYCFCLSPQGVITWNQFHSYKKVKRYVES